MRDCADVIRPQTIQVIGSFRAPLVTTYHSYSAWHVRDVDWRRNRQECSFNLWSQRFMGVRLHRESRRKMLRKNRERGVHDLRARGSTDTELPRIQNLKGRLLVNTNHARVDLLQIQCLKNQPILVGDAQIRTCSSPGWPSTTTMPIQSQ